MVEDREAMAKQAREIAEHFESLSTKEENKKPNLFTEKVARYKQYAKDGLVRIDDDSHVLYSQWVPKAQGEGINTHCPAEWLKLRMGSVGRFGTIKKAF